MGHFRPLGSRKIGQFRVLGIMILWGLGHLRVLESHDSALLGLGAAEEAYGPLGRGSMLWALKVFSHWDPKPS